MGEEGHGLKGSMRNFNRMRIMHASICEVLARQCYEEALDWARLKRPHGTPLVEQQATRHNLVDMLTRCNSTRALLISTAQAWYRYSHYPVSIISRYYRIVPSFLFHFRQLKQG